MMQHHCQVRSSLDGKMTSAKRHLQTPNTPIHIQNNFLLSSYSSLVCISLISSVVQIFVGCGQLCVQYNYGAIQKVSEKRLHGKQAKIVITNYQIMSSLESDFQFYFSPGAAPMLIWLGRRRHNVPDRLQFNIQRFLMFWDTKYKVQYIQMLCRAGLLCIHGICLLFLAQVVVPRVSRCIVFQFPHLCLKQLC